MTTKRYISRFKNWSETSAFYNSLGTTFTDQTMDDSFGVPVLRINNLVELEDEDALMKRCYGLAVEKDSSIVKVLLPEEFAEKLRSVPAYPRLHGREIDTAREEITQYDSIRGVYMREQYTHKKYFADDFINPSKSLTPKFKTTSSSWLTAEQELWADIERTQNKTVIYGSEQGYTLFPETFTPLNINKLTGVLKDIRKVQGHVGGITSSMTYFGQARSTFSWHVEDEHLFSTNYLHFGEGKVWYGAPLSRHDDIIAAFREWYPDEYLYCRCAHRHKKFFVKPSLLWDLKGIAVKKTVQRPNQLMVTVPRGYHEGFNLGINCAEASNWGDLDIWYPIAKAVHENNDFCHCGNSESVVVLNHQSLECTKSQKDLRLALNRIDALEAELRTLRSNTTAPRSTFRQSSTISRQNGPSTSTVPSTAVRRESQVSAGPSTYNYTAQLACGSNAPADAPTQADNSDGQVVPAKRGRPKGSTNKPGHKAGGPRIYGNRKHEIED